METNDIRNYEEVINTGIRPSTKYIEKVLRIRSEDDKDACLRFLTINNKSLALCRGFYTDEYIRSVVESSDALLYVHTKEDTSQIVAFALVQTKHKKKGKILNILLVCAVVNKHKLGKLIAHSLYNFAVTHAYLFLYVSPRTPALRATFMKYGFESIYGREGIDEVLEKELERTFPVIHTRGKTQKQRRTPSREDVLLHD